ncbi:hypothetical protein ABPG77_006753 [Micractinium sp. CCAP 211/92]
MAESPADDERSYYALLGVSPGASDDEIKRAYRQLATTLHPDKVANAAYHDEAALLFTRIQEAYEVLSDPQQRDIYDVYGKEGLAAGLQLGDKLKTRDELRAEWEAFQKQQKKAELEASVNYRGVYQFKIDATALVNPYARHVARTPELTNIYMTSGLDVPLESRDWGWLASEQDVAHLGGLVNVRKNVGGGSFLAGYKRHFADFSSFEVHGAVGLRTLLSAQHTVQLSPESSASLVASWQPNAGVGLQFVSTRQLSPTLSGEYSWVVGPLESSGMSLGLTRRTDKLMLTGRLEVGAVTGLVCRAVRQLSAAATGRLALKLTTAGIELDVGGSRRFSETATAGCAVTVGLQGITLKLRYNRAGHLFEFPILLSSSPLDWPTLAGAYLLPPLLYLAGRDLVVGPLSRGIAARRSRTERQQQAEVIRAALALARSAAELMLPVARRRLDKEQRHGGLVVALALYGEEAAVAQMAKEAPQRWAAAQAAAAAAPEQDAERQASQQQQQGEQQQGDAQSASEAAQHAAAQQREQQQQHQQAPGGDGGGGGGDVPPAVADVTVAVQYMVESSKVVFHKGYPKSGLMGFCDPAPGAAKALLVYFTFKGRPYRTTISDSEGASLPARGVAVEREAEAEMVLGLATQLGSAAAAGAGGSSAALSSAPSAASLASLSGSSLAWLTGEAGSG